MNLVFWTLVVLFGRDFIVYGILTNGLGRFFVNPYLWSATISAFVTFCLSYWASAEMEFTYPETIALVAGAVEFVACLITLFSCFIAEHLERKQWIQHLLFVFANNTVPAIKNIALMMYMLGWASVSGVFG